MLAAEATKGPPADLTRLGHAPVPRPLRVMHVVYCLGLAGTELGVVKIVKLLDGTRFEGSIACWFTSGAELKRDRAFQVFEFGTRPNGNDWTLVAWLYRLFRQERPDIVHTHAWGTLCEGFIAARLARVPLIVHGEHGTLETRRRSLPVQRWVWSRADQVLSVSSRLSDRMADDVGFPRERIVTIPNGVDLQRFRPGTGAESKRALGLEPDDFVIGTAGRLVPVKDHHNLLTALSILKQQGLGFRAVIAGDGPLEAELRLSARELGLDGIVRWLGNRPDIETVLRAMDVFVLSSRSEGLSNTILEAMATRLPVVATHVGGADEAVEDSSTGFLVPPQNPMALAEAITAVAVDPMRRHAFGAAGRRRAKMQFGVDRMIQHYEAVYLGLAERHPALRSSVHP